MRPVGLPVLLLGCVAFASPAAAWLATIAAGEAKSVISTPNGDVVAGGQLRADVFAPRFVVTRRDGATGKERWRAEMNQTDGTVGSCTNFCSADHLAVTADGDVLVGGVLTHGNAEPGTLLRLDGQTGAREWVTPIVGAHSPANGLVRGLVLDGAGDVVAIGSLLNGPSGDFDVWIAKIDADTGAELWRYVAEGDDDANGEDDLGAGVVVDAAGDVLGVGTVTNVGSGRDFEVVKVAGATGERIWRATVGDAGADFATGVATDAAGHAYVVGETRTTTRSILVVKLDAATGAELWRQEIDGRSPLTQWHSARLRVDGAGDVVLADGGFDATTGVDFTVLKLSGSTGDVVWRTDRSGAPTDALNPDVARALDIAPDGSVVAAGALATGLPVPSPFPGSSEWLVLVLDPTDGSVRSSYALAGTAGFQHLALAVAAGPDRVAVAGSILNLRDENRTFAVLHAAEALDGRRLIARERATRDTVVFRATDRRILAAAPGTEGDPTLHGASLTLRNPGTGESVTLPLPAAGWVAQHGRAPGQFAYQYRAKATAGPCTQVKLKSASILLAKCNDLGTLTLDEASQGALEMALRTGTGGRFCARFVSPQSDVPGSFVSAGSPAPADCP